MSDDVETKEQRNARIQRRWDDLMARGAHGHYETLFRIVREETQMAYEDCAEIAEERSNAELASTFRAMIRNV